MIYRGAWSPVAGLIFAHAHVGDRAKQIAATAREDFDTDAIIAIDVQAAVHSVAANHVRCGVTYGTCVTGSLSGHGGYPEQGGG